MTFQILTAVVRSPLAARVIQALVDAGCRDLVVQDVRRVLAGLDRASYEFSVQMGQEFEPMVRLDAVGSPEDILRWSKAARAAGSTGRHGDGIVSIVDAAAFLHLSTRVSDL